MPARRSLPCLAIALLGVAAIVAPRPLQAQPARVAPRVVSQAAEPDFSILLVNEPDRVEPALPPPRPLENEAARDFDLHLGLPSADQVFQTVSEADLRERIRQEALKRKVKTEFPVDGPPSASDTMVARHIELKTAVFLPSVVCHRPLYFEDKNGERYGWHVPCAQPLLSTGKFYINALLLPYHLAVMAPWTWECNEGWPLPGDPVPYQMYALPCAGKWSWAGGLVAFDVDAAGCAISP